MPTPLQAEIRAKGQQIFDLMANETSSIFSKDYVYGQIMDWSMRNENFKVQMFRFVDVLPYLNSSGEVLRHLKEYFQSEGGELPKVFNWGLGLSSLAPGIIAGQVKKNVTEMAKMFITGQSGKEAVGNLRKLRGQKLTFTVDILGEAAVSEKEADEYMHRYLELIESLASESRNWPEIEQIDRDHEGAISKVNVSVKISALYSQIDPIDSEGSIKAIKERLRPIFRKAKELGVFINLDMESYTLKDLTLDLFKNLMDEAEFKNHGNVGLVIQAYLCDSEQDLENIIRWAKTRSGRITIRLVKGAYWDYETVHAQQKGWPVPVFLNKKETDANYEKLSLKMLQNDRFIKSAFGSHNVRSIAHALVQAEKLGVDPRSFEIQMLYGMAEPIKKALVKIGFRVREYAPVGELIPGMAYLVRRLLENTSNEGFLRSKFAANFSSEELLRDPAEMALHSELKPIKGFHNEPPADFSKTECRQAMHEALGRVKKTFGKSYPLVIGKKDVKTREEMNSVSPARPGEIIGRSAKASIEDANAAVEAAFQAKSEWARTPGEARARILEKAAEIMRSRRFDLAALEVYEVGKTWREADGDITEAIDFCMYYAQEIRKLAKHSRTANIPGEASFYHYRARGVGVVIAPWNFPLAILCGMVTASLVTGNTVIMKPAEQSAIIGWYLMDILREAGLPAGVLNLITGLGEEVGAHLVDHPKVDFIAFTGSKEVGLKIYETAGRTHREQESVKHVVCEMGGKNGIIVDSDADLDEAVIGCLYSAFGFQGQKCSALSRLIVLDENYDRFVNRLLEAAKSLKVGFPEDPATSVGPVIDEDAFNRIKKYIDIGKKEATLAFQGQAPGDGYFIAPTIFTDVKPTARIAQEEIFGPVLAIIRVKDFDEALRVANGTEYALTGGLYSRSPANIERAKQEFDIGNLYINRGITGAMVGRHPFGGYKMSGGGTKAGGRDYLLHFMHPRVYTENTLRRGFAPNEEDADANGI